VADVGARVHAEPGVRRLLSQRLRLSGDFGSIAALNIYSHAADAFEEHTRAVGLVLANTRRTADEDPARQ